MGSNGSRKTAARGKSSPGKGAPANGASKPASRGKGSAKPRRDASAAADKPRSSGHSGRAATAARSAENDSGPKALLQRVARAAAPTGVTGRAAAVQQVAGRSARKTGRRLIEKTVPALGAAARGAIERARDAGAAAHRARSLPIQRSIDVAVPLQVAWDEWTRLDFLPEGAHRVRDIERGDDAHLVGRLAGPHAVARWEAQILDERVDESFAWRSQGASDCAGLVTFHRLGDRLTRIELQLDVVPKGLTEAAALLLRLADHRAEADLRRFKARIEAIDPDEYLPVEGEEPETAEHQAGENV